MCVRACVCARAHTRTQDDSAPVGLSHLSCLFMNCLVKRGACFDKQVLQYVRHEYLFLLILSEQDKSWAVPFTSCQIELLCLDTISPPACSALDCKMFAACDISINRHKACPLHLPNCLVPAGALPSLITPGRWKSFPCLLLGSGSWEGRL